MQDFGPEWEVLDGVWEGWGWAERPRLEKAEGTLWLGASQWSSGSAKEATRAGGHGEGEGEVEGEVGCGARETKEVWGRKKAQDLMGKMWDVA